MVKNYKKKINNKKKIFYKNLINLVLCLNNLKFFFFIYFVFILGILFIFSSKLKVANLLNKNNICFVSVSFGLSLAVCQIISTRYAYIVHRWVPGTISNFYSVYEYYYNQLSYGILFKAPLTVFFIDTMDTAAALHVISELNTFNIYGFFLLETAEKNFFIYNDNIYYLTPFYSKEMACFYYLRLILYIF
jgi:hypothetical protein